MAKARPATISWLPWWLASRPGRWLLRALGLLVIVAGLVAAVIWLGHWTHGRVQDDPRYQVAVADIVCDVPDGMERAEFLDQVQYYGRLADRVGVLDEELPTKLKEAFARHPWVANADDVTLTPPTRIAVRLTFRVAVLAVPWKDEMWAVDGDGVRLPKNAATRGLPIYDGTVRPPRGPPGTHWGDSDIERAARKLRAAAG